MQGPSACWKGRCGQQRGPTRPRAAGRRSREGPVQGPAGRLRGREEVGSGFPFTRTKCISVHKRQSRSQSVPGGVWLSRISLGGVCGPGLSAALPPAPPRPVRPGTRPRRPGWCVMTAPDGTVSASASHVGPAFTRAEWTHLMGRLAPGSVPTVPAVSSSGGHRFRWDPGDIATLEG